MSLPKVDLKRSTEIMVLIKAQVKYSLTLLPKSNHRRNCKMISALNLLSLDIFRPKLNLINMMTLLLKNMVMMIQSSQSEFQMAQIF